MTQGQTEHEEFLEKKKAIVDLFHTIYYMEGQKTWMDTHFLGSPVLKCPLDLWVYQEIIVEGKPDLIIETGTFCGGSALFMATVCDALGNGRVMSVDIDTERPRPAHPRIRYLYGSSTAPAVVDEMTKACADAARVMVILDSGHGRDHVYDELQAYAPLVTSGQYLIVEDTNINGHPVRPDFGPGPTEALVDFLKTTSDFEIDRTKEKFLMTQNPGGYLRCVR